jgi:hypothetical protein
MPENTSGVPARGRPIDTTPLPGWARPYFTPDQLGLDRGLLWVLLVYKARTLGDSATNVAQRYYVHSIGKSKKVAWPSLRSLMGDLELSINTVRSALAKLEGDGWLMKAPGPAKSQGYALAWPEQDCLAPTAEGPARCGQPTKTGGWCTRRAGRGTSTPGEGPCVEHGGTPKNRKTEYQPLIQQTGKKNAGLYQPLTSAVSAADTEYVRECVTGVHQESDESFPPSRAEVEVPHSLEPKEDQKSRQSEDEASLKAAPDNTRHSAAENTSPTRSAVQDAIRDARRSLSRSQANGPKTTTS